MTEASVEVRCTCRRHPILAMAGRSDTGSPFLHVKSIRNGSIQVEVVVTEGRAYITCRECGRRTRVNIKLSTVDAVQERLPEEISLD